MRSFILGVIPVLLVATAASAETIDLSGVLFSAVARGGFGSTWPSCGEVAKQPTPALAFAPMPFGPGTAQAVHAGAGCFYSGHAPRRSRHWRVAHIANVLFALTVSVPIGYAQEPTEQPAAREQEAPGGGDLQSEFSTDAKGQIAAASSRDDPTPRSGAREVWAPSAPQHVQQTNQRPSPAPQDQSIGQRTHEQQPGSIVGTVTDVLNGPVAGATVVLQGPVDSDRHTVATDDNGVFEIRDVPTGIPHHITISAEGFSDWVSSVVILEAGQRKVLTVSQLQIRKVDVAVTVRPKTNEEIATEQVQLAEKQRGFGVLPNYFEVFPSRDGRPPAPLGAKLKFRLAFKAATDPVTIAGAGLLAEAGQAGGFLHFSGGLKGLGQRLGASYANSFTDIMIGGAVLPSLLHQDPRYFYQGTGTKKSRAVHAISNLFIAKGDNGRLQPNYSMLGGDLASAALSNLYYPGSNRGAGQVLQNFGIETAIHISVGLLQEFLFRPAR